MSRMNKITNHMPTAELQAIDAAHHMHPFSAGAELAEVGARVIKSAKGVMLTDSDGHEILDGMAGLWCVNIGYGRDELAEAAYRQTSFTLGPGPKRTTQTSGLFAITGRPKASQSARSSSAARTAITGLPSDRQALAA